MSLLYLIEERQLMFFSKLQQTDNIFVDFNMYTVLMVKYEMLGLAANYGLSDVRGLSTIRDTVSCFVQRVQL